MSVLRQIPIEDIADRTVVLEPLSLGYGQEPPLRKYEYDPINDAVVVTGPIIEYHPPDRPA